MRDPLWEAPCGDHDALGSNKAKRCNSDSLLEKKRVGALVHEFWKSAVAAKQAEIGNKTELEWKPGHQHKGGRNETFIKYFCEAEYHAYSSALRQRAMNTAHSMDKVVAFVVYSVSWFKPCMNRGHSRSRYLNTCMNILRSYISAGVISSAIILLILGQHPPHILHDLI